MHNQTRPVNPHTQTRYNPYLSTGSQGSKVGAALTVVRHRDRIPGSQFSYSATDLLAAGVREGVEEGEEEEEEEEEGEGLLGVGKLLKKLLAWLPSSTKPNVADRDLHHHTGASLSLYQQFPNEAKQPRSKVKSVSCEKRRRCFLFFLHNFVFQNQHHSLHF